ncbi:aldo/keto reductase [Micromonospora schwarzwaldensis]|uniref:aldo/keto reductase n=1 Tax=Micromonospora sp. DSM 45708 TaxID=3111767 RepID=UPI0031DF3F54
MTVIAEPPTPSAIVEGQWIAQRRGRGRVVSEQPPYSILAREVERELLPLAQRYGLAVTPWNPLAGGWLSGRYHGGLDAPISRRADRFPARFDPNPAAKVTLSPDVLDRIDAIVPPGSALNPADAGYQPLSLADPPRRRRGGTTPPAAGPPR